MSNRATTWAWDVEVPSKIHRLVLLCLADHHNGLTGDCFPSLSRIVERTMCGLTAVKAALRKLDQMGLISRSERSCLRTGRTVGVVYGLAISDRDRGPQGDGGGSCSDRPGGSSGDRPYSDEPETITRSEPRAGAGKADLRNAPRKERNYEPMRRSRSSYKSGALQLLEEMYAEDAEAEALIEKNCKGGATQMLARRSYDNWKARQPKRNFKSGAARRLQEIHEQMAREAETGVIVDANYWSDDDA